MRARGKALSRRSDKVKKAVGSIMHPMIHSAYYRNHRRLIVPIWLRSSAIRERERRVVVAPVTVRRKNGKRKDITKWQKYENFMKVRKCIFLINTSELVSD